MRQRLNNEPFKNYVILLGGGGRSPKDYIRLQEGRGNTPKDYIGLQGAEVQKIFFFLSSRYNCAIFSAAFKKF